MPGGAGFRDWLLRLLQRRTGSEKTPLEVRLDELKSAIETNHTRVVELQERISGLQENLDELGTQLKRNNKEQFRARALLEQEYKRLQDAIAGVEAGLTESTGQITQNVKHYQDGAVRAQAQMECCIDLIGLMDGLSQCLYGLRQVAAVGNSPASGWYEGLAKLHQKGELVLAKYGIKPIPAVGRIFNPELHRAVEVRKQRWGRDGEILEEYRRGYRIQNRVLRFSEVAVARVEEKPNLDKYRRKREVKYLDGQDHRNRSGHNQFSCISGCRQTAANPWRRRRTNRSFGGGNQQRWAASRRTGGPESIPPRSREHR